MSSSHLEQHRAQMRKFQELQKSDPTAAREFAGACCETAAPWRRNDPRRGDALELMALTKIDAREFRAALDLTTEVLRIRQKSAPVDEELLALAQGQHAVALFANDREKEADEMLRQQLETWRQVFGPNDVRFALKLEGQAEYVQAGFGRNLWAIESLQEAIKIRERDGGRSSGRLAEDLQKLAMLQIGQRQWGDGEENLRRAQTLLEGEIARDPTAEETKAGLAQILVLLCGLAGVFARKEDALAYAEAAKAIKLHDRLRAAEKEIEVATAISAVFEMMGDWPRAIAEQERVLDVFEQNQDLSAAGALDIGLIPETVLSLGSLYLQQNDLDLARTALEQALGQIGERSDLLLKLAELERKSGNETKALQRYQEALRGRKEAGSEMRVLFGTNRGLDPGPEIARFGSKTVSRLALGEAVVLVPGGQFSAESWLQTRPPESIPVGLATNPTPLVLRRKRLLNLDDCLTIIPDIMARARLYPEAAFVFVHGFNVPFDDALRRGAQLVRDLNFDGPAFVFSWPSRGRLLSYRTDRRTADKAARALANFLGTVQVASDAKQIHILAHSMGNRVLLPALEMAATMDPEVRPHIGEVIFAAPAVPRQEFASALDRLQRLGLKRFTLYASAVDKAMWSAVVPEAGKILAGFVVGGRPLLHPRLESVDLTEAGAIGLMNLNHDTFASNPVMIEDIRQLLQTGLRPPGRRLAVLKPRPSPEQPEYWAFESAAGSV